MKQSGRTSLVEAIANVAIGYGVAVVIQIVVFPLFGILASIRDNLALDALFTIVSVIRSFALCRLFEAIRVRTSTPYWSERPKKPLLFSWFLNFGYRVSERRIGCEYARNPAPNRA